MRAFILFVGMCWIVSAPAADKPIRVLVWDEQQPAQKTAYPQFLGNQIAAHFKTIPGFEVTSVNLSEPEQGLTKETIENADVVIWWGHIRQKEVSDERAQLIVDRIKDGKLGLIALHSAHFAKPFTFAMNERAVADALKTLTDEQRKTVTIRRQTFKPWGAPKSDDTLTPSHTLKTDGGSVELTVMLPNCCFPNWRADGAPSHVTTLLPEHPIAKGIPAKFDIPKTEMYNEPFHVPAPDAVVFEEKWDKGEHFRAGMVWNVGNGKVFYFRPGHETYRVYHEPLPLQILVNATRWIGRKE